MRLLLVTTLIILLTSCNSSSTKEADKKKDDTTTIDNPAVVTGSSNFMKPEKMNVKDLPSAIQFTGVATEAWQWIDNAGENLLVLSAVAPYNDTQKNEDGEEGQTATIHATQFIKKGDAYDYVWKMNDIEKACAFDMTLMFIPGSTTITDLDKNGIAETKLQYALACRSDVSPAYMKLIMYEGDNKYLLKGLRWIKTSPEDEFTVTENTVNLEKIPKQKDEFDQWMMSCGRYETEKSFVSAPPEFLQFARGEWMKYVIEKMGD